MPKEHYQILQISLPPESSEQRGSRTKFWIRVPENSTLWLLKFPRTMTGEHWAEKVATEIGHLIGVNCAKVELARCIGQQTALGKSNDGKKTNWQDYMNHVGTICRSFLPIVQDTTSPTEQEHNFFHGYEVLQIFFEDYDINLRFGQREHNVKNILQALAQLMDLESVNPMPLWNEELKALASYVLFDGLIGNTDRHHENWMIDYVLGQGNARLKVLPSFDHASSLGRELTDERRGLILRDQGMLRYLMNGRGGVFIDGQRRLAPSPLRLAQLLCRWAPEFTRDTYDRIVEVSDSQMWDTIDKVPPEVMSDIAKEFAYKVIATSRAELLRSMK